METKIELGLVEKIYRHPISMALESGTHIFLKNDEGVLEYCVPKGIRIEGLLVTGQPGEKEDHGKMRIKRISQINEEGKEFYNPEKLILRGEIDSKIASSDNIYIDVATIKKQLELKEKATNVKNMGSNENTDINEKRIGLSGFNKKRLETWEKNYHEPYKD